MLVCTAEGTVGSIRSDYHPRDVNRITRESHIKMAGKILCVAEKPSIAKAVANHLAGGSAQVVSQEVGFYYGYCLTIPKVK